MSRATRTIVTAFASIAVFFVMGLAMVGLAMGCDNYSTTYDAQTMPFVCKASKAQGMGETVFNIAGWLAMFGLPLLAGWVVWQLTRPKEKARPNAHA